MKLDSDKYLGFFNFYLTPRCAVDDELFTLVTAGYDIPTAKIHKQLQHMATEKYLNDHLYYLHAVRAKKIKKERRNVSSGDRRQGTLDGHLVNMSEHNSSDESIAKLQRELSSLQKSLRDAKLKLEGALAAKENPIYFSRVKGTKSGNNYRNKPGDLYAIPGIGIQKLDKLIANGFPTGKSVAEYDGPTPSAWKQHTGPATFRRWRETFCGIFNSRTKAVSDLQSQVNSLESLVEEKKEALSLADSSVDAQAADTVSAEEEYLPAFSKMNDTEGYNARVLSVGRIKSIRQTDFRRRKPLQMAKMFNQVGASDVLKVDSSYKLAAKIKVYEGVGRCFQPYKCHTIVHDRNACTIYHKMCSSAESIDEISEALKAISLREGTATVKVIYVDNPKTVERKIKLIFPTVQVKVDPFHWMKLWNDIMADCNSESSAIFRNALSRAVFQCAADEWIEAERKAKERLRRLNKLPPHGKPNRTEVRKFARTTIPSKAILLESVRAVIDNCMVKDLLIDLQRQSRDPDDTSPLPKRFFKTNKTLVDTIIQRQYETIRQDFLSDPENIDLYRRNPHTGRYFNCRGTNSNETDNLHLDRLTGNHLGIQEADRLITTFFEISNDNKRYNRLGEQVDIFTYR
jgi:hypothetical protein